MLVCLQLGLFLLLVQHFILVGKNVVALPLFLAKLAGVTLIIGNKGVSCKLFFALVIYNLLLVAKNIVVSLSIISILRFKVRLFVLILKAV